MSLGRRPLRILMTADTVGGVWSYARDLARGLAPSGVEVVLATMGRPPSPAQWAEAAAAGVRLVGSAYRLEWMEDPWDDVARAGRWLRELADEVAPDVVHLNGFAHGALDWPAPVVVVGHSCVLSWWEAVKGEPAPPEWRRYRAAVTRGLAAADAVVAPSRAMLEALAARYGVPRRCRVIHNGSASPVAARVKEELIFAAGRLWDEAKNLASLDAAAADLAWPVHVAGDAAAPDGGERRFRHLRTHGVLPQPAVFDWLGRAAIYALPARYEPFGLSILEAARAGCALVLGDIASLREIWGDAALFVPPEDSAALAAALRTLIGDPGRRADFAARAQQRAAQFTLDAMAAAYRALYDELACAQVDAPRRASA